MGKGTSWLAGASSLLAVALLGSLIATHTEPQRQRPQAAAPTPAPTPVVEVLSKPLPAGMAGEFEEQSALLLSLDELVGDHPEVFVELVGACHEHVRLLGTVSSDSVLDTALAYMEEAGLPEDAIQFVGTPRSSVWMRDFGPLFVRTTDGRAALLDANYALNIVGREDRQTDDMVPRSIARALNVPLVSVPTNIEGGNLLPNGDGLIVTSVAFIEENLEQGTDAGELAETLGRVFGFKRWMFVEALPDEGTQHVDMFLVFTAPDVVLVGEVDAEEDPIAATRLDDTARMLGREMTSHGPMQVHRIPMPAMMYGEWRTWTNVVFANGVLVVPTYADVEEEKQKEVLELYRRVLPDWEVVGINVDSLMELGGALHCIVMNVPAFVPTDDIRFFAPTLGPGVVELPRPE
jgi:agmatine/peptidylarginine deiminase